MGRDLVLEERTLPTDGYSAEQKLHAGYGMLDIPASRWLRLTGGARVESFHQAIEIEPPSRDHARMPARTSAATERTNTDALPAGGAIVQRSSDNMSVRLAYGGTVARPLVRELAPFLTRTSCGDRTVIGNPDLKRTYIHNFDVRWEMFPSPTEVLAASAFYKVFSDPIEAVVQDAAGNLSFQNIESARNYGVELEARMSLGRITDALRRSGRRRRTSR